MEAGFPRLKPKNSLIRGVCLQEKACRGHRPRTGRQISVGSQGSEQSTVFTILRNLSASPGSSEPCWCPCELRKRYQFPSFPIVTGLILKFLNCQEIFTISKWKMVSQGEEWGMQRENDKEKFPHLIGEK